MDDFLLNLISKYPATIKKVQPIPARTVNIDGMELPAKMEKVETGEDNFESLDEYIRARDRLDENIRIKDTRTIHPVTGEPINPNRDLITGTYSYPVIMEIIREAKKAGYDPYKALAVGLQETGFGKTDTNIGHVLNTEGEFNPEGSSTNLQFEIGQMISTLKHWDQKARKTAKYNTDEYALQAYNAPGILSDKDIFLSPKTEKLYHHDTGRSTQYFYGVDVSKKPLNLRENPAYGKTVMSLVDVLKQNKEINNLIKNTPEVYLGEPEEWVSDEDTETWVDFSGAVSEEPIERLQPKKTILIDGMELPMLSR